MPATATDRLNGLTTSVAVKPACVAVTSSNITLSGLQTVGGVALAENDRVLVKSQSDQTANGIYLASTSGWTRAEDFDGNRDVTQGTLVLVRSASADGAIYEVTTANPVTIGTSNIVFALRDDPAITYAQTDGELGAVITPVNFAYPPGDVRRYGAVGDDSTDNTVALQACISVCEFSSLDMFVPEGVFRHGDLTISNVSLDGFRIRGVSSGDYGTSLGNDPSRGSILKYTGTGTGITVDSGAVTTAPKYVTFENLTFLGNSSANDGVLITRATWCRFFHCVFAYYNQSAGNAVRLTLGSGTFTGGIRFVDCDFVGNDRCVYLDSYPVNIITFADCGFHSNEYVFVQGADTSTIYFIRHLVFRGCDFEETVHTDILLRGGVAVLVVDGNYFEQNDSDENDPRIWLANTGTSPLSQAVRIQSNVFSKLLGAASSALVRIRNTRGLSILDNWLIDTDNETDRYAIELVATVSNYTVEMMHTVFGDAGYPIRIASTNWFQTVEDYDTPRVFRSGGATLFYPDATDARADTGAQGYLGETLNTQSGNYTLALVDRNAIVLNGSNGGPTYTIPANATIAFPVGTVTEVINDSSASMTLARAATVANVLSSTATDQNVTIAARGVARLRKVGTNRWITDGVGLS